MESSLFKQRKAIDANSLAILVGAGMDIGTFSLGGNAARQPARLRQWV